MKTLAEVQQAACEKLNPRAEYARDVVMGRRRFSGSDLQGAARRYGAKYSTQRKRAIAAFQDAGGILLTIDRGLVVGAVFAGYDSFGSEIYETTAGLSAKTSSTGRAKLIEI